MSRTPTNPDPRAVLEAELARRNSRVRSTAAFTALLKIVPAVGEGLYEAVTGGGSAADKERVKLQMDLIITLLLKIDEAISAVAVAASDRGATVVDVNGTLRVDVDNAKLAMGMLVSADGQPVKFGQGTVIELKASNVDTAIGLAIGMPPNPDRK